MIISVVFFVAVKIIFSVSLLFSSEKAFIVNRPTKIGKTNFAIYSYVLLKSIALALKVNKYIIIPIVAKNIATTIYPIGEKNNALMNGVAQKMGDAVNGVPYLIVGDYTLNGYSESDNEAILKAILDEYGKDESSRVTTATDYINNFKFEEKEFNGVVVGVVVAVVAVGLVVIIVKAREE